MGAMASPITGVLIIYLTIFSGAGQWKYFITAKKKQKKNNIIPFTIKTLLEK